MAVRALVWYRAGLTAITKPPLFKGLFHTPHKLNRLNRKEIQLSMAVVTCFLVPASMSSSSSSSNNITWLLLQLVTFGLTLALWCLVTASMVCDFWEKLSVLFVTITQSGQKAFTATLWEWPQECWTLWRWWHALYASYTVVVSVGGQWPTISYFSSQPVYDIISCDLAADMNALKRKLERVYLW